MVSPVLLDSSVLFPNVLRDTLLTLAEHDLFEPQWSTEILAEVSRNVIAQRSVPASVWPIALVKAVNGYNPGYADSIPYLRKWSSVNTDTGRKRVAIRDHQGPQGQGKRRMPGTRPAPAKAEESGPTASKSVPDPETDRPLRNQPAVAQVVPARPGPWRESIDRLSSKRVSRYSHVRLVLTRRTLVGERGRMANIIMAWAELVPLDRLATDAGQRRHIHLRTIAAPIGG